MSNDEIVSLNARIPKKLKDQIKILAIQNNTTMQDLFTELLRLGIENI